VNETECWRRLASVDVGRVALTHRALPWIVPAAFTCIDQTLILDVGPATLRRDGERGSIVCFEADAVTEDRLGYWCVRVVGPLDVVASSPGDGRAVDGSQSDRSGNQVRLIPRLISGEVYRDAEGAELLRRRR
jgi:nitroimidazol reductase NimA-like FMN-containing flavoprotein (pyridoxamine 5'-phosphate oxidase superfamily)